MPNMSTVAGVGLVKVQVGVEVNGNAREGEAHRSAAIATELRAEVVATRTNARALIVEGWEPACIGLIEFAKEALLLL